MKKADITFHNGQPAVNVKLYRSEPTDDEIVAVAAELDEPGFTRAAIDALTDDERQRWWEIACEDGWALLQEAAEAIYGPSVRVYSEGRSGGWAVLGYEYEKGRHSPGPDVDAVRGWDAIELAKWARFARLARAVADDNCRRMAWLIAANVYQPEVERTAWLADPQRQIEI